ncbi:MAG: Mov34/MPN/PAD-1 family protein, partial [Planctomycetes bacterium]|nr:Mov34/MPN/PAD-1 family protein [Planctomycetota bacterium]
MADVPDVRQLDDEDLPQVGFPASRRSDFRVYFAPDAHRAAHAHSGENRSVEICGVLVGRMGRDADGPFISVEDTIRCDEATSRFAEVTFTHESWARVNAEMDSKHADKRIVGWYHTHPDFGIFLSERDTFIHQHFFSGAGQIALVLDPVRKLEGAFAWRNGRPEPLPHYWVGDRLQLDGSAERPHVAVPAMGAAGAPAATGATDRGAADPPLMRMVVPVLLAFLIGYLLAGQLVGWRSAGEREAMFRDMVTSYAFWKVLRPELTEQLQSLDAGLAALDRALRPLAREHVAAAGKKGGPLADRGTDVLQVLARARRRAAAVRQQSGLSPAET